MREVILDLSPLLFLLLFFAVFMLGAAVIAVTSRVRKLERYFYSRGPSDPMQIMMRGRAPR